jgi:hypothetical protein
VALVAAAVAAAGVLALSGDEEDGESGAPTEPVPPEGTKPTTGGPTGAGAGAEEQSDAERRLRRTVERYIAAIDDRDGRALCELVPSLTAELDLPAERGGCAASVRASIGYADPRGFPQWRRSSLRRIGSAAIDGSSARVVATVVTYFADRKEPSIEDDVLYLEASGGRWRLAKPSATLYRAIGAPDVPPAVLRAP